MIKALAEAVAPELAADEQLRHGFLLHDVGKVGIPESQGHPLRPGLPGDRRRRRSQFDPAVVDAFTAIVPDLPGLHAALHDGTPQDGALRGGAVGGGAVDSLAGVIP